jgi:superfamily I DNA/RNA helicase
MFNVLARHYAKGGATPPFDFAVVDEAQDISIAQMRFLASMAGAKPNGLFFAGDLGQRIFQQPFSWKAAGAEVRGRATTLKINYRTSHQIRSQADRLLDPQIADVDGNEESRKDAVSLFNGPKPDIKTYATQKEESEGVTHWLRQISEAGLHPHEIALFVRSTEQVDRATKAAELAGIKFRVLDEHVEIAPGILPICTMHLAKGLEFRAVCVMACDDEVIPLQERIEAVADESDLEDVYNTERHLLYVACTRARDQLLVTSTEPASEFLGDMVAVPN